MKIIELDGRRRAALGSICRPDVDTYVAEVDEAGVITLTPAIAVPLSDLPAGLAADITARYGTVRPGPRLDA